MHPRVEGKRDETWHVPWMTIVFGTPLGIVLSSNLTMSSRKGRKTAGGEAKTATTPVPIATTTTTTGKRAVNVALQKALAMVRPMRLWRVRTYAMLMLQRRGATTLPGYDDVDEKTFCTTLTDKERIERGLRWASIGPAPKHEFTLVVYVPNLNTESFQNAIRCEERLHAQFASAVTTRLQEQQQQQQADRIRGVVEDGGTRPGPAPPGGPRLVPLSLSLQPTQTHAPPLPVLNRRLVLISQKDQIPPHVAKVAYESRLRGREVEYWSEFRLTYDMLRCKHQAKSIRHIPRDPDAQEEPEELREVVATYGPVDKWPPQLVDRPVATYFAAKVGDVFRYERTNAHGTSNEVVWRRVIPGHHKHKAPSKAQLRNDAGVVTGAAGAGGAGGAGTGASGGGGAGEHALVDPEDADNPMFSSLFDGDSASQWISLGDR